jgi:hypothetical protein
MRACTKTAIIKNELLVHTSLQYHIGRFAKAMQEVGTPATKSKKLSISLCSPPLSPLKVVNYSWKTYCVAIPNFGKRSQKA